MNNKLVRILLLSTFAFSLNACVSTKELANLKPNEATSIANIRITMDGNKDGDAFGDNCFGHFLDKDGKYILSKKDNDTGYYIFKSAAGPVQLQTIECISNKIIYNKVRRKTFQDLYFNAQAGKFNYAGHLFGNWESDRLKIGDLLLTGAGGITEDEGTFELRLLDRYEDAKTYLRQELELTDPSFNKSLFKDHEQLTK